MNFDEFTKVHEVVLAKEPRQYRSFIYFYDGIPNEEDVINQATNQQQVSIPTESQSINAELHSGTKLQSRVRLHPEAKLHSKFKL